MPDPSRSQTGDLTADHVSKVVGQRVAEFRQGLDLTLEGLAALTGLSIGMISKIERGQTSPSFATMTALANATGMPFTAFFRGLDEEHDAILVRAGEGVSIDHEDARRGRTYHDLGSLRGPRREIEPVLVTFTERDEVFPLFQHAGVEFIYLLQGRMEYGYGAKRYLLGPGDTLQLHGEVAHGPTELVEVPLQFLSIKVHTPLDATADE